MLLVAEVSSSIVLRVSLPPRLSAVLSLLYYYYYYYYYYYS